jgi:hypothetical protein
MFDCEGVLHDSQVFSPERAQACADLSRLVRPPARAPCSKSTGIAL